MDFICTKTCINRYRKATGVVQNSADGAHAPSIRSICYEQAGIRPDTRTASSKNYPAFSVAQSIATIFYHARLPVRFDLAQFDKPFAGSGRHYAPCSRPECAVRLPRG